MGNIMYKIMQKNPVEDEEIIQDIVSIKNDSTLKMKMEMEINMQIKMQNIMYKIQENPIEDGEIIRDIESIKNDPGFDIKVYEVTLMRDAVCENRNKLVEYLLADPNINVNGKCRNGLTAIFHCLNVSILKLLLDHRNIDVNIQYNNGYTVLHSWCYYSNSEQIKMIKELLIDGRIDLSIKDNCGKTALDYAIKHKYYDIAKMIIIMSPTNIVLSKDLARRLCEYM